MTRPRFVGGFHRLPASSAKLEFFFKHGGGGYNTIPFVKLIERIISRGSTLLCNIEAMAGNDTSAVAKCFMRDLRRHAVL